MKSIPARGQPKRSEERGVAVKKKPACRLGTNLFDEKRTHLKRGGTGYRKVGGEKPRENQEKGFLHWEEGITGGDFSMIKRRGPQPAQSVQWVQTLIEDSGFQTLGGNSKGESACSREKRQHVKSMLGTWEELAGHGPWDGKFWKVGGGARQGDVQRLPPC